MYVSSATLCSKSGATLQHRGQKTFFIISELSDSHGHIKLVCRPCSVRRSKSKKRKKIDSLSISTNRELPLLSTVNTHRDFWIQTSPSLYCYKLICNIRIPLIFHHKLSFVLKFALRYWNRVANFLIWIRTNWNQTLWHHNTTNKTAVLSLASLVITSVIIFNITRKYGNNWKQISHCV
jgi:hypothetical protein